MAKRPPFQLVAGDRYNLSLGVLVAFVLASLKDAQFVPAFIRWNIGAYTNWNLILITVRAFLKQEQWDPFLCVNSMGVFLGFRTAMAQGLDENMRKKLEKMLPIPFPRWQFLISDHIVHTLPPIYFVAALVKRGQRVSLMNSLYAATLATWFSFRQQAKLDSSGIYVPHPWRRAWFAIFTAMGVTPFLVEGLIKRSARSVVACVLALMVPWLTSVCDPNLKKTYTLDFMLADIEQEETKTKTPSKHKGLPRITSVPVHAYSTKRPAFA
eukprot:TRINITY_DN20114_c0_g1_i1.p1 TRINITY_DN20114_c0_g1~~TRINITY_DN20114_c0_g1_i1.p1  ORF type:complete len:268 (-),score=37.91 TRINITY_DN20114_c0_g1_i1:769-1572(-)